MKREITGDIGLVPQCDIPPESERINIVERYFFGVRYNSKDQCTVFVAHPCVFTVYVNHIVLDLHMKSLISTNIFSCAIKDIEDVE